jgi:hypothetical protein
MGKDGGKTVIVKSVNLISLEDGLIKRSDCISTGLRSRSNFYQQRE